MLRDTAGDERARSSGLHRRLVGLAASDDHALRRNRRMKGAIVLETGAAQLPSVFQAHAESSARAARPEASRELRHEVGNALTTASAYSQWLLLRRSAGADEREYRALPAIRDSVARALRL